MTQANEERALDLLVARATEGLDTTTERELEALLAKIPELDEEPSFELAAASIDLAYTVQQQPLPEALRGLVSAQATEFFAASSAQSEQFPTQQPATQQPSAEQPATASLRDHGTVTQISEHTTPNRSPEATRWLGWLAAAAVLLIAIMTRPSVPDQPAPEVEAPIVVEVPVAPTTAEARAALVAQATDLIQLDWTATDDPAAQVASGQPATGDVVWSSADQAGFMRFNGLAVNDPGQHQYQLWIFDAEQDERYPVDGGVFNIPESGEVIVPIAAALPIVNPTLFAITVEKPGGVVVSSRERLPLLAKVS